MYLGFKNAFFHFQAICKRKPGLLEAIPGIIEIKTAFKNLSKNILTL